MFILTVNVEVYNGLEVEKRKESLGVFTTMEAAIAVARREIIRQSAESNTNVEIKNHIRGHINCCGSVFKYDANSIEFKEVRHYWADSVRPTNDLVKAACDLYEDKCVENEYPELNAMLLKFISDKLEK